MRIYSFSSFVNKSFVSVPLYFFKLRPLLKMYGINALTRRQLRRLNKKLM